MLDKDLYIDHICINPDESISCLKKYAVRVIHKPTGLVAQCGMEKAQHKNRQICLEMLEMGLTNKRI